MIELVLILFANLQDPPRETLGSDGSLVELARQLSLTEPHPEDRDLRIETKVVFRTKGQQAGFDITLNYYHGQTEKPSMIEHHRVALHLLRRIESRCYPSPSNLCHLQIRFEKGDGDPSGFRFEATDMPHRLAQTLQLGPYSSHRAQSLAVGLKEVMNAFPGQNMP